MSESRLSLGTWPLSLFGSKNSKKNAANPPSPQKPKVEIDLTKDEEDSSDTEIKNENAPPAQPLAGASSSIFSGIKTENFFTPKPQADTKPSLLDSLKKEGSPPTETIYSAYFGLEKSRPRQPEAESCLFEHLYEMEDATVKREKIPKDPVEAEAYWANEAKAVRELLDEVEPGSGRLVYHFEQKQRKWEQRIDQLKGRPAIVARVLEKACVDSQWYLFACDITRTVEIKEPHDCEEYESDELEPPPTTTMTIVATCRGEVAGRDIELQERELLNPNHYYGRDADDENTAETGGPWEGWTDITREYYDSGLLLVHKTQMGRFLRENDVTVSVVLDMVIKDIEAHPENTATRKAAGEFLLECLKQNPSTLRSVLELAWRMKEDSVFDAAVRAGFKHDVLESSLIYYLVQIAINTPPGPFDWDRSFGEFIACHNDLTQLHKSWSTVKSILGPGDRLTSFLLWRATMDAVHFERRESLAYDDHDAILELAAAQWRNVGWISNTLVRRIRDGPDRYLHSKFVCSMLEKDRKRALPRAIDQAIYLLQPSIQKLRLTLPSPDSDPQNYSEFDRFCDLIDNCLQSCLQQAVDELLYASLVGLRNISTTEGTNYPLSSSMLGQLCAVFEKHGMMKQEPARSFVIVALDNILLRALPQRPQRLPGFAHRPRGCPKKCGACRDLDEFLVSPTKQVLQLELAPRTCEHIRFLLPTNLFLCSVSAPHASTSRSPEKCDLRVVKLGREFQSQMDRYYGSLGQVMPMMQSLRTRYVRDLIGINAYLTLVSFEHLYFDDVEPSHEERVRRLVVLRTEPEVRNVPAEVRHEPELRLEPDVKLEEDAKSEERVKHEKPVRPEEDVKSEEKAKSETTVKLEEVKPLTGSKRRADDEFEMPDAKRLDRGTI